MWSVKQAAELMVISEQRVRKLLQEGRIKGKRLNGTWVVLRLGYQRKRGYNIEEIKTKKVTILQYRAPVNSS